MLLYFEHQILKRYCLSSASAPHQGKECLCTIPGCAEFTMCRNPGRPGGLCLHCPKREVLLPYSEGHEGELKSRCPPSTHPHSWGPIHLRGPGLSSVHSHPQRPAAGGTALGPRHGPVGAAHGQAARFPPHAKVPSWPFSAASAGAAQEHRTAFRKR